MLVESLRFFAVVALGLTFLVSGLNKLRDPQGFVLAVLEYEVLPQALAVPYGRLLPFAKTISGAALPFGVWPAVAGLLSAALLPSFLAAVGHLRECFGVSERRACRAVGISRSALRYEPRTRPDELVLRERLRKLAAERRRFGYPRLHVLLAREGLAVNHKRVERLYHAEGLTVF